MPKMPVTVSAAQRAVVDQARLSEIENETRHRRGRKADGGFKGKKNIYLCQSCGHGFVSQDVDEGTTAFLTNCLNPTCGGRAQSLFYTCPQETLEKFPPALEWYRPDASEIASLRQGLAEYVEKGGLLPRRTGGAA